MNLNGAWDFCNWNSTGTTGHSLSISFVCFPVFECYTKYSKVDVAKAIDLELKGDIESLLVAIGKTIPLILSYCSDFWVKSRAGSWKNNTATPKDEVKGSVLAG